MAMAFSLFLLSAVFALAAIRVVWQGRQWRGLPNAVAIAGPGKDTQPRAPLQIIQLSNHAVEKINAARGLRYAEYEIALGRYQTALAAREYEIKGWTRAKSLALSGREWRTAFKSWWRLRVAMNAPVPQAPLISLPGRAEVLWTAGQEGERRLDAFLNARLNGNWTLLAGYKNAKGEADRILVGPEGVFAFEVKNINGVIHCDGDCWWRDKRDRYGNVVEQGVPIADNGGRGPSRQINETADGLERFLEKRAVRVSVVRVVIFTHDRSALGSVENIAVNAVATLGGLDLERILAKGGERLDDCLRQQIVSLIRQDHDFHASRVRRQPAPATRIFSPSP